MTHKFQIVDLIFAKEAVSTRRSTRSLNQAELLVETYGVHTDASQRCSLSDLNRLSHTPKNKPWS
jgi:DNA polymerase II large subunit